MAEYRKPLPMADADSKEFWDGCKRHELLLQKCDACHKYYFPPGPVCPHCFSTRVTWTKASGKGSVYTYTNVRRALGPDSLPDLEPPGPTVLIDRQPGRSKA